MSPPLFIESLPLYIQDRIVTILWKGLESYYVNYRHDIYEKYYISNVWRKQVMSMVCWRWFRLVQRLNTIMRSNGNIIRSKSRFQYRCNQSINGPNNNQYLSIYSTFPIVYITTFSNDFDCILSLINNNNSNNNSSIINDKDNNGNNNCKEIEHWVSKVMSIEHFGGTFQAFQQLLTVVSYGTSTNNTWNNGTIVNSKLKHLSISTAYFCPDTVVNSMKELPLKFPELQSIQLQLSNTKDDNCLQLLPDFGHQLVRLSITNNTNNNNNVNNSSPQFIETMFKMIAQLKNLESLELSYNTQHESYSSNLINLLQNYDGGRLIELSLPDSADRELLTFILQDESCPIKIFKFQIIEDTPIPIKRTFLKMEIILPSPLLNFLMYDSLENGGEAEEELKDEFIQFAISCNHVQQSITISNTDCMNKTASIVRHNVNTKSIQFTLNVDNNPKSKFNECIINAIESNKSPSLYNLNIAINNITTTPRLSLRSDSPIYKRIDKAIKQHPTILNKDYWVI